MKFSRYKILSVAIAIGLFAPFALSTNGFLDISIAHGQILESIDTFYSNFVSFIAIIPVFIGAFLLFIAGLILDITITETILQFATFANTEGLNTAWRTFRDLGNIFIVFALLTIAISTIIGSSSYMLKNLLAKVIIVALLLNFSLFFTKFVIEITNRLAVEFHSKIVPENSTSGVSAAFMQVANLNSFWDFDKDQFEKLKTTSSVGRASIIGYGMFVGIFYSIAAATLLFAAWLLITRAVVLSLLMILSPLAFVAYTLPATKKHADAWWDALSKNAIFAPIFFILLWATLQVANGLSKDNGSYSEVFLGGDPIALRVVFTFAILIGLTVSSIVVAQKLSISGGAGAVKGLKGLGKGTAGLATRGVGRATFGTTAAFGRTAFGRSAHQYLNSENGLRLQEKASGKGFGAGFARMRLGVLDKAEKGSFDVRGTGALKSASKAVGVDLGKPIAGYDKQLEKRNKRVERGVKAAVARETAGMQDGDLKKLVTKETIDNFAEGIENRKTIIPGAKTESKEIADLLRKNLNKGDNEKLIDATFV